MRDDNCIFCKLANGDIPTNTIYEDADFRVILDASPQVLKKWEPLNPKSKTSIHRPKRTIHPLTAKKRKEQL